MTRKYRASGMRYQSRPHRPDPRSDRAFSLSGRARLDPYLDPSSLTSERGPRASAAEPDREASRTLPASGTLKLGRSAKPRTMGTGLKMMVVYLERGKSLVISQQPESAGHGDMSEEGMVYVRYPESPVDRFIFVTLIGNDRSGRRSWVSARSTVNGPGQAKCRPGET